jgi:hypothetical protein
MDYKFLVTTDVNEVLKIKGQVIMVDGTVPGWTPNSNDLHFDHHRENGEDTQIQDIGKLKYNIEDDATFVTTQVDADVCVAAAWLIGLDNYPELLDKYENRLLAIAYDCDHLVVPSYLSAYSDFATKVVAAMKSNSNVCIEALDLSADRKTWSKEDKQKFGSLAFECGVTDLCLSIQGFSKFPGENGEADSYLQKLNEDIKIWETNGNIHKYREVLIFDCTQVNEYLDPRVTLRAAQNIGLVGDEPFTVTQRKIVNNGEFVGYSYTIGVVPLHKNIDKVNYVSNKVFEALTLGELKQNHTHFSKAIRDAKLTVPDRCLDELWDIWLERVAKWLCSSQVKLGWGGRRTVGGSSWNTPSKLSPQTVVDVILKCDFFS